MTEKKLIAMLTLDSNEFAKKFHLALEEVDGVQITGLGPAAYSQEAGENLIFAVMNARSSNVSTCTACCAKHRHLVKELPSGEKGLDGLCSHCSNMLMWLVKCKVSKETAQAWMKSEGKIDPWNLLRDAVEKLIKSGDIKMTEMEL